MYHVWTLRSIWAIQKKKSSKQKIVPGLQDMMIYIQFCLQTCGLVVDASLGRQCLKPNVLRMLCIPLYSFIVPARYKCSTFALSTVVGSFHAAAASAFISLRSSFAWHWARQWHWPSWPTGTASSSRIWASQWTDTHALYCSVIYDFFFLEFHQWWSCNF